MPGLGPKAAGAGVGRAAETAAGEGVWTLASAFRKVAGEAASQVPTDGRLANGLGSATAVAGTSVVSGTGAACDRSKE